MKALSIEIFANYVDKNKSTLNITKTKYIVFKDQSPPTMSINSDMNISYRGQPKDQVREQKRSPLEHK